MQINLFRPLFIREKVQQELISAVSGTDVPKANVVAAALKQRVVAVYYLDDGSDNALLETMTVMQLVLETLSLHIPSTLTPLQLAVQLETSLLADLKKKSEPGNASIVFQYALKVAVNTTGLPFAVACGALLTLQSLYPYSKWDVIVLGLLQQRFGSAGRLQGGEICSASAIEQLAILQLRKSLQESNLDMYLPGVDVSVDNISHETHIMDIALQCRRPDVAECRGEVGQLIAMVDWCEESPKEYLFWRPDHGDSAISTAGLHLHASADTWTCSSVAVNEATGMPFFQVETPIDSEFAEWLRKHKADVVGSAFQQGMVDFLAGLNDVENSMDLS